MQPYLFIATVAEPRESTSPSLGVISFPASMTSSCVVTVEPSRFALLLIPERPRTSHPAMARNDHFRDGGHAHQALFHDTQEAQISRQLERAFTQISANGRHTCGLRADGSATCWGNNEDGESTPPCRRFHPDLRRRVSHLRAAR